MKSYKTEPDILNINAKKDNFQKRDIEIVKCALDGDYFAYDELYNTSLQKAISVAIKYNTDNLLTNAEIIEAANEAFTRCILKLEEYKDISSFSTWLGGFVKNVVRETRRKKIRTYAVQIKFLQCGIVSDLCISPENYIVHKEECACARGAYLSLDECNRALISWKVLKEISKSKMLRTTKISRNEVNVQAEKALLILRKRFFEIYGFVG